MGQLEEDAGKPATEKVTEERQHRASSENPGEQDIAASAEPLPAGKVDLPSVDDITENSDVSMFMAANVSEDVRRSALRRLFQTGKFNQRDGLDVYCADYNCFEPLGDIVTADMRHRLERMARAATCDQGEMADTCSPEQTKNALLKPSGRTGETPPEAVDSPSRFDPETVQLFPDSDLPPDTAAVLESAFRWLLQCTGNGGVCLHDAELPADQVESFSRTLNGEAIVLPVASIVSMGSEVLLALLACGASRVVVLTPGRIGDAEPEAIEGQVALASAVLDGLGLGGMRVGLARSGPNAAGACALENIMDEPGKRAEPAAFSPAGSGRALFFQSVDRLWEHSLSKPSYVLLPTGSPFGSVAMDASACTLCKACIGVCPSGALSSGSELPEIYFREVSCSQCGLCRKACPENAIRLSPRILFGPAMRNESLLLCRTEPFGCVVCGEPFATAPIVARMIQKLSGHRFYRDETAQRRLQMCADCRVRDLVSAIRNLE